MSAVTMPTLSLVLLLVAAFMLGASITGMLLSLRSEGKARERSPDEIQAEAKLLFAEAERLQSLLPTDYFADPMTQRHGRSLRGGTIEASEIEGVDS